MEALNKDTKILVAVPTMGSVHPILVSRLLQWTKDYGSNISFYFTFKVAPVERARNQVAKFFLHAPSKFTHLFFIDADTIPPVDAIKRLLSHDKDVISGLTPILSYQTEEEGGHWASYDNCFVATECDEHGNIIETHIPQRNTGLQEIFRCGASCLLIKREVFEKIPQPYFRFLIDEDGTTHVKSEDINFCDEVRKAGIQIFADTDVVCQHYKDIMI